MPAYERRVVHAVLSERAGIISDSVGEEPNRMVVVKPTDLNKELDFSSVKFDDEQEYIILE